MTTMHITTVREVVDAFGGTGAMAEFLHIVPSAVSNMLRDNHIPRAYHLQIFLELQARGYSVNTKVLFGIHSPRVSEPSGVPAVA